MDGQKVAALPEAQATEINEVVKEAKQGAVADVIIFPLMMLAAYIGLILYFRSRGGYKPVDLHGQEHADARHAATEA